MKRPVAALMSLTVSLVASACSVPAVAPASQSPAEPSMSQPTDADRSAIPPTVGAIVPTPAASEPAPQDTPANEPTAADVEYRVTYDWAVPSNQVTIPHPVQAPIASAPALPLPYLAGIYVSDHQEASPKFQRISFYFRGAFPEYNLQYVPSLTAEGSGAMVPLDGNAVLQIGFVSAQAHDNDGASTVIATPTNPIGFQNLRSYGFAGDYEG